jgi:conjugative transposon TraN protein
MDPYPLQITYNKTTNLVFSHAVKAVDRGSDDILVQRAMHADTIVQLKARKEGFSQTNLSVLTADGRLYSFLVEYVAFPTRLNYLFNTAYNSQNNRLARSSHQENELDFLENSKGIARSKRFIHGIKNSSYNIDWQLDGIYVSSDHIYFQLQVRNKSNLPYCIDILQFAIKDKKVAKRTSTQEIEIKPVYRFNNTNCIYSQSNQQYVFVLRAFTIANSKYLAIQLSEKSGGRDLVLKIRERHILKARRIEQAQ